MCHRCDGDSERAKGGGACKECSGAEVMEWWMLSEEEAAYMHSAFPVGQTSIDHILLQCPECKSVNFPGTEQCLIINRGGQMTSQSVAFPPAPSCPLLPPPAPPAPAAPPDERAGLSGSDAACALNPKPETRNPKLNKPETPKQGRVMREQDYRAVTRHVTNACSNVPLTQVAGRLTVEECLAAAQLIGSTPEAEVCLALPLSRSRFPCPLSLCLTLPISLSLSLSLSVFHPPHPTLHIPPSTSHPPSCSLALCARTH